MTDPAIQELIVDDTRNKGTVDFNTVVGNVGGIQMTERRGQAATTAYRKLLIGKYLHPGTGIVGLYGIITYGQSADDDILRKGGYHLGTYARLRREGQVNFDITALNTNRCIHTGAQVRQCALHGSSE